MAILSRFVVTISRTATVQDAIQAMVERTAKGGGELVKLLGTSAWYAPGPARRSDR